MIKDQVIYLGPRLHAFGVGYGAVFYNGLHPTLRSLIEKCPAIGELVVPVAQAAAVRRELNFDYAHNMKGTSGKFVTFYREVQSWLSRQSQSKQTPTLNIQTHA
jgi:hypothetical protein